MLNLTAAQIAAIEALPYEAVTVSWDDITSMSDEEFAARHAEATGTTDLFVAYMAAKHGKPAAEMAALLADDDA